MRLFRLFVAALCLAALGFTAAPARAGTIKFSPLMWENRPGSLSNLLNRRDCLNDAVATTSVSILGVVGGQFELWSGAGCDQYANRSPTAVSRTCSKVVGDLTPINQELTIHFRDLIKAYNDDAAATDAVCDLSQSPGLLTRTLYFVVSDPNTNMPLATGATSWAFKYDIKAPPPPSNVSAQSGDQSLVTSFSPVTGETNLLNYRFYCSPASPAPGNGTAGTAGTDTGGTAGTDTGGTAGTDTSGTAGTDTAAGGAADTGGSAGTAGTAGTASTTPVTLDPNCQSSILVPGQPAPADAIPCGSVKATGSSGGETSPVLENSGSYVVAVATEDNANNVGVLSGLACNSPRDIRGFYEAYRTAGGEGGGGYCSFAPAAKGSVASMLGLLLGAAALLVRRRR